MTTYFTAPDGIDEPTLWAETDDPRRPVAILRHRDLGGMAHHWDELVARVIAGNPDRMIDRDALTQGIEQINNTDNLAAAIADRTENAAAALRVNKLANKIDDLTRTPSPPSQGLMQLMPEWKPNVERPCTHESWQLDGNQRTCAECGQRLSDDPDRQPRRINPTFMT